MEFIDVFSFILTRIMLGLLSHVKQKQTVGKVETKTHLIASCVRNISAKNY